MFTLHSRSPDWPQAERARGLASSSIDLQFSDIICGYSLITTFWPFKSFYWRIMCKLCEQKNNSRVNESLFVNPKEFTVLSLV